MRTLPIVMVVATLLFASACKKEEAPPPKATTSDAAVAKAEPPDAAPPKPPYDEFTGFAAPESVLLLADQDVYLVSNINGDPGAADDNGFISKLGADGKIIELKWIDGASDKVKLDAPKGMGVRDGKLYVTDIGSVRIFDLATGEPKGEIAIKGATFLNDIAVAGDKVYVTDSGLGAEFKPTGTDAVYEIDAKDKAKKLIGKSDIKGPNGLYVADDGQVWLVGFGGKQLARLDGGKLADLQDLPTGGLDGIGALGDGRFAISSWEGKAVYAGKPGANDWKPIIEGVEGAADILIDAKRKRIVVPVLPGGFVRFYSYE